MAKNPGLIVETKTGKIGRTYNKKGLINGKVPVYVESDDKSSYSDIAILCDPKTIIQKGIID
jgi:hypothetical protein